MAVSSNDLGVVVLTPKVFYLVLYNLIQCFGWLAILLVTSSHVLFEFNFVGIYDKTAIFLYIFQTGALLEILHAVFGLVKSNPIITAVQVYSRLFVLWGIIYSVPEIQNSVGVFMCLEAWSIAEIIRYAFYTFNLLGEVPHSIIWCRYTLFIILYPVGVTGELLSQFLALPLINNHKINFLEMPNRLNLGIDFSLIVILTMISYIPIFPQLYLHMFKQRKKALAEVKEKSS